MKYRPLSLPMFKLYALAACFFTASSIITVIFPLQAAEHGFREGQIGIMMGLYMFTCMFLRPWAGQLIAKYTVLTVMKGLLVGHAAAIALYLAAGVDSLYVVRALQGIVTAFFSMAMQLGLGQMLRDEDRGQGMSMYSLSTVLPGLYGPALAMLLWSEGAHRSFILLLAVLAVIPLLFLFRTPLPKGRENGMSFSLRDMSRALKDTWRHTDLLVSAMVMLAGAAVLGAVTTFLPLYMVTTGIGNAALYLLLQAVTVVISRFVLRKRVPSDGRWHPLFVALIMACFVFGTLGLAVMSTLGPLLYLSAVCNGLGAALLYPTLSTYMSFAVPKETKHILFGVFLASYDLGTALGGFVMGFVVQGLSFGGMFACCALLAALVIVFICLHGRQHAHRQVNAGE